LGLQYCAVLEDGLYLRLAQDAMKAATRLDNGLRALGLPMLINSPSNQLFPILENDIIRKLEEQVSFEVWGAVDENRSAIRFVTAWHTTEGEVDALLDILKNLTA
jgi:threonine aldolase